MGCKTRRASLRRAKQALDAWCRRHRHQPVKTPHAALSQRGRGPFTSCGVSGHVRSLLRLVEAPKRAWDKWRWPSQPAHTLAMEEVWRRAPAVSSPPPTDDGPHLGRVATSHINGRAGWWKSPCPDLARGWDGQPPSLLYKPLVTRVFSTDRVRPPVLPCRLVPTPGVGPPGSPPSLASAWPCGHAWCG
jgi:hypothetical protein